MRQSHLLKITEGTRNELDGGRRRGVLPIAQGDNFGFPDDEAVFSWADFTLSDALRMRVYFDLTRGGLKAQDVKSFVGNGFARVEHGEIQRPFDFHNPGPKPWLNPPRGLFDVWEEEIWIAREVWTCADIEEITKGPNFSVTWHGGTKSEIERAVADLKQGFDQRETLSLQLYNLSLARKKVLDAAREINLPELDELEGGKA
ncbi:hypothetical protein M2324_003836 [Rhodovulum sulfidophilum]|uniref:hypothetical protein n=1 Tax=Rhodovulum sulfidophilum TaxID=35806 RepID=UPI0005A661E9|nr:hypothetical protein [Rhodovulum sulfidophilum]ANB32614.1 hypothetical protein A6W98_00080 [Rhodovulum sulfidophilum DSM 1374]ANB36465.1 hypothetical protein A6024_00080 [Rhodovulum sulfidophilum]MCW2305412.1 hypothetical protein [Rhodovulum sulfidophilum]